MMGPGFAEAAFKDLGKMLFLAAAVIVLVCIGVEHLTLYLFHHIALHWKP